jgi:hypothetical protein
MSTHGEYLWQIGRVLMWLVAMILTLLIAVVAWLGDDLTLFWTSSIVGLLMGGPVLWDTRRLWLMQNEDPATRTRRGDPRQKGR